MGSKSSNKKKLYSYEDAEEPAPVVEDPAPLAQDVSDNVGDQQARNLQKDKKGRSWSLVSRSGSDSRRTKLAGNNTSKLG